MSAHSSMVNFSSRYHQHTFIAALIAAIAATISAYFSMPPWVMFIGWVAYFTNPGTIKGTISSALCTCLGVLLGIIAASCVKLLIVKAGVMAFAIVVFFVAIFVVSMRGLRWVGNIVAWFLGLITYFAIHTQPTPYSVTLVVLTIILGSISGYIAHQLQQYFN